jgi:hypothetical protein
MYQIISDIDKPINLQRCIDNREGNKKVGLKSFTYTIGWHNLIDEHFQKGTDKSIRLSPGFYSFQQISDKFQEHGISLTVNEANGIVFLTSPVDLKISKGLKEMLGLGNKRRFNANQTYEGETPVDFAPYKQLYVYLNQINSYYNFFDGAPSNILCVVPVENKSFGDIVTHFSNPKYKQLSNGDITELNISVCDENGKKINNNGLPISCELEIIS